MKQRQLVIFCAVIVALTCATPSFADSIGQAYAIQVKVTAGNGQRRGPFAAA